MSRSHATSGQFTCHCPLTFHLCPEWQHCLGSHASSGRGGGVQEKLGLSTSDAVVCLPDGSLSYLLGGLYNRCYKADK